MIIRFVLALITVYQQCRKFLPRVCRFYPSCSTYMQEAIRRYGLWTGMYLGAIRLCKCHPYHPGGLDPIPESFH